MEGADIILANGKLLLLTLHGELILAPASPKEFKIQSRAQILPYLVRAYPALSDGLLFGRSKDKLVCVDLRTKK